MIARPDVLLRLESLLVLSATILSYRLALHGPWWLLAALFLVPDFSLAGYLLPDKRIAALLYNAIHSYVLPILLAFAAWQLADVHLGQIAAIWIAHIAFDRLLGFGLKFP
jgi:mannitol-specific phosphotransferase system IIBC component